MAIYSLFYFTLVIIQTEPQKDDHDWYLQRSKGNNSGFLET